MQQRSTLIICTLLTIVVGVGFIMYNNDLLESAEANTIVLQVPVDHSMQPSTNSPQQPDSPDSHWFYSELTTLTEDTIITGFDVDMKGADESVLHHLIVGVYNKAPQICPNYFVAEDGFFELYSASRNTLDPVRLPAPYGLHLSAGDQLIVEFMAHPQAAPHGVHSHGEELSPTLEITLHTDAEHTVPAYFTRLKLDDSPCQKPLGHQAFVVPTSTPDTVYTKTSAGNEQTSSLFFASSSQIILGGANFWPRKGGQNVSVLIDDKIHTTLTAEQGPADHQWNIPLSAEPIDIPASSTLSIQSEYINPFDTPVKDASGMYGFYYVITE